jgi:hypothetical protein
MLTNKQSNERKPTVNNLVTKTFIKMFFPLAALFTLAIFPPMTCFGESFIEVSPNIINIDANRFGDIRIFTNLRYANYDFSDDEVYVYINPVEGDAGVSVENIRPSRDSLGNLILRFNLQDLLAVPNLQLNVDDYNTFEMVIVQAGDEFSYQDDSVYIMDKKSP